MNLAADLPVLFDCDGVVLDSNAIKTEAFRVALAGEPEDRVEALVTHHRATGGVSRYEKLNRYFSEAGRVGADLEAALAAALARFGEHVRAALRGCPMVPGADDVLTRLTGASRRVYLVSGGDESELRDVFAERGLSRHFEAIMGSPTPKDKHLSRLREEGVFEAGGIFLGDARLDMEVADAFGLDFVFVAGVSDWAEGRQLAGAGGHLVVEDLSDPRLATVLGLTPR